ncbi:MAG: hypothetical protein CL885_01595, partial [Dehalococcoidia bacterium]|nr:hypothetical protein [Dehalococcoidia bacterium]
LTKNGSEYDEDYLYYIPPHQSDLGSNQTDSRIQIKCSYQRPSDGVDETKIFTDIESLKIIQVTNGESAPFVTLDNASVELPLTYDGSFEKSFDFNGSPSVIEAYLGEGQMGVRPDRIKVGGVEFVLQEEVVGEALLWKNATGLALGSFKDEDVYFSFDQDYMATTPVERKVSDKFTKASNVGDDDLNKVVTHIKIPLSTEEKYKAPAEGGALCAYNVSGETVTLLAHSPMPNGYEKGMFSLESSIEKPPKFSGVVFESRYKVKIVDDNDSSTPELVSSYYEHYLDTQQSLNKINASSHLHDSSDNKFFEIGQNEAIVVNLNFKFYKKTSSLAVPAHYGRKESRRFLARRTGHQGSTPTYRGVWTAGDTYFGNSDRRDLVYHDEKVWIAKEGADEGYTWANDEDKDGFLATDGDNSEPGKTDAAINYWSQFGQNFQSVATNLLLSEDIFVKRGIVAGINDSTDAFFASQIDKKYFQADLGGYKLTDSLVAATSENVSFELSEGTSATGELPDGAVSSSNATAPHYTQVNDSSGLVTTHKLPMTPVPGFFLGYYKSSLAGVSDSTFSIGDTSGLKLTDLFPRVPMLELQSPFGNFIRWDGFSLKMFGAVINGSVSDESVDVQIGSSGATKVDFNKPIYGGQVFCGGGFANHIPNDHSHLASVVVGGGQNKIFGDTSAGAKFSFIGGGYGNRVRGDFSFIGGGFANMIGSLSEAEQLPSPNKFGTSFNAIVTGMSNRIYGSGHSFIGAGFGNSVDGSMYSSIVNGENNFIQGYFGEDYLTGQDSLDMSVSKHFSIDGTSNKIFVKGSKDASSPRVPYQKNWSIEQNRRALEDDQGNHMTITSPNNAIGHNVQNKTWKIYELTNATIEKLDYESYVDRNGDLLSAFTNNNDGKTKAQWGQDHWDE